MNNKYDNLGSRYKLRQVIIDAALALAFEFNRDWRRVLQIGAYGRLGKEKKFLHATRELSDASFDRVIQVMVSTI